MERHPTNVFRRLVGGALDAPGRGRLPCLEAEPLLRRSSNRRSRAVLRIVDRPLLALRARH
jgi:hypothetical protein